MANSQRLYILNNQDFSATYEIPQFNDLERRHFFVLSEPELNGLPIVTNIIGANEHEGHFTYPMLMDNLSAIDPDIISSTLAIFPEPFALRSVRSTRLEGLSLKRYFDFRLA